MEELWTMSEGPDVRRGGKYAQRISGAIIAVCALLGIGAPAATLAVDLPIFDAHIHYSKDAWEVLTPKQAVERLRKAGVVRALVSSSSDDGTQKLYAEAPDLIVPELRPYRTRAELNGWFEDSSIISHVEQRLKAYRYVAIGEIHLDGEQADTPVVRRVVQLAKQHGLMLHVHSDADAITRIFQQDPQARILWAHAGFEEPTRIAGMMRRHRQLWADLSFRFEVEKGGKVSPEWRALFLEFPDRFMVGTDTYTPERWGEVGRYAAWVRTWLADLPPAVARRIAHENGESVLTKAWRAAADRN